MNEVRTSYGNIQTEEELLAFIDLLDRVDCELKGPYLASATMQRAQFVFAPWTQYRYFTNGKKQLEDFIRKYPSNLEARYIRFLIQSHAPFFLGYNRQKDEDAGLIFKHIYRSDLPPDYIRKIKRQVQELRK